MLPKCINVYWMLKNLAEETISNVSALCGEHKIMLEECMFSSEPVASLPSLVKPSIMTLHEEDDKKGMHELGPFFVYTQ
ncbi:unnamed protein product [Mucor hiemalis]